MDIGPWRFAANRLAEAFDRFLRNHGHREVDFDAYHPTWSGQPWVVLENLRLMLLRETVEDPSPREQQLRARQQAMSVRGALGLLEDGEQVRVSGTAGTVSRLSWRSRAVPRAEWESLVSGAGSRASFVRVTTSAQTL